MFLKKLCSNWFALYSTVGLAQQWDQLDQLGMRMQHNLEQQIQARNQSGVSEDALKEFSMMFKVSSLKILKMCYLSQEVIYTQCWNVSVYYRSPCIVGHDSILQRLIKTHSFSSTSTKRSVVVWTMQSLSPVCEHWAMTCPWLRRDKTTQNLRQS